MILSKYYDNYLDYFFSNPKWKSIESYPYASAHQELMNDRYFWSDYYKVELPAHGHEVEQLVIDAQPLQLLWAKEHNIQYAAENWYFDIIIEQINYYKPEILFIQDWSCELGASFIKMVKDRCQFVKAFIGYCGEGHPGPGYFQEHDIVISCAKDNVEYFRKSGLNAHHIYHAFFPDILKQLSYNKDKSGDVAFIGRVVASSWAHKERAFFLSQLSEKVPIVFHGQVKKGDGHKSYNKTYSAIYNNFDYIFEYLNNNEILNNYKFVSDYYNYKHCNLLDNAIIQLKKISKRQYLGLSMFDKLREYNILLNYHISPRFAANLRMFEVTGMGTCLVTDHKENIKELFEPDFEIVTYSSIEEAAEKISYLLSNRKKIDEIAQAGQKRTLQDHTYKKRAVDLHQIINSHIS